MLKVYGGNKIKPIGQITLRCKRNKTENNILF